VRGSSIYPCGVEQQPDAVFGADPAGADSVARHYEAYLEATGAEPPNLDDLRAEYAADATVFLPDLARRGSDSGRGFDPGRGATPEPK
jgi:hypothetical protein